MRAVRTIGVSIIALGLLTVSAVGATAQSALVTGSITDADMCEPAPGDAHRCSGGRFEFDDARLTGDYETTIVITEGSGVGFAVGFIETGEIRVTNAGGAWSGRSLWAFATSDEPVFAGSHWVLTGEAGYEGLTAYVGNDLTDGAVRGFILDEDEPVSLPVE